MPNTPPSAFAVTFPPSLGNELGLWALDHYGVKYRTYPYSIFLLGIELWWKTRQSGLPTFKNLNATLVGPRAIVDYFESNCSADLRLLPWDQALRQQVLGVWPDYFDTLGNAVATWSYFNLLPHKQVMLRPLTRGVPIIERCLVQVFYPLIRMFLSSQLGLSEQTAATAVTTIRQQFQATADRLSDGRAYLFGESLTLADLCFAANAAPVVLPDECYGGPPPPGTLPTFAELPDSMKPFVTEMRQHPAGLFALKIYRLHRTAVQSASP
ncbi:MAG: hypothetical protein JSS49_25110 [Planctomycetes bacterium]|nr:hypothetical protein [Planctomycetota bacterium]